MPEGMSHQRPHNDTHQSHPGRGQQTQAARRLHRTSTGESIIQNIMDVVGISGTTGGRRRSAGLTHAGEGRHGHNALPEADELPLTSQEVVAQWRRAIGIIPGAQELSFRDWSIQ